MYKSMSTESTDLVEKTELGSDFWGIAYYYHGVWNDSS